jgi:hypothetical protein
MAIKVGGTTVINDSRALTNIASVDATTVAALGTAGVGGGGGSFDAVASGTIANGALVSLNSDGTVSTTTQAIGNTTQVEQDINWITGTFDSNSNKVVVAYRSGNGEGWAVVGSVSGSSITFGTAVNFNDSNTNKRGYYISAVFDTNSNKVVICFQDDAGSDHLKASVGTVSGTSISFGSTVTLFAYTARYVDTAFDPDTNTIIVTFSNSANYMRCLAASVSGTSISVVNGQSFLPFGNTESANNRVVYDTNSNKAVFFKTDGGISSANGRGMAVVGTNGGSGFTFGTPATFCLTGTNAEEPDQEMGVTFDSTANKIVVAFRDGRDTNKGKAKLITVSGTSITFGATSIFNQSNTTQIRAIYDSNADATFVTFRDDGEGDKGTVNAGKVSGTSIDFVGEVTFLPDSGNHMYNEPVIDTNSDRLVVLSINNANSNRGNATVCNPVGITNFNNWVGISESAISNSATGTITVLSGISENQSNLSAGKKHYLQDNATISSNVIDGREVGKALSATKLLITQGSIS